MLQLVLDNTQKRSLAYSQTLPRLVRNICSTGTFIIVLTVQNAPSLYQSILKMLQLLTLPSEAEKKIWGHRSLIVMKIVICTMSIWCQIHLGSSHIFSQRSNAQMRMQMILQQVLVSPITTILSLWTMRKEQRNFESCFFGWFFFLFFFFWNRHVNVRLQKKRKGINLSNRFE